MSHGDRVVVIGSGGHAAVCIDSLLDAGIDVIGALGRAADARPLQVPLVGDDSDLPRLLAEGVGSAFVAIGDNRHRAELMRLAVGSGFALVNAVSPGAQIAGTVELGVNVAVMAGAVINAYTRLGDGVIVNTGASVDHDGVIEAHAHVAPGCRLAGKVVVAQGAFVGIGSSVIPELRIGRWSRLGAGSVVVNDIEDGVLAMGAPARKVRML